jgi:hypothetical protein
MLKLADRSFRGRISSGVAVKPQNGRLECLIITKTEKKHAFSDTSTTRTGPKTDGLHTVPQNMEMRI